MIAYKLMSRRTTEKISVTSLTTLISAAAADAAIITNTDLGLPGFTVNNAFVFAEWNFDNAGSAEAVVTVFNAGNSVLLAFGSNFVTASGAGTGLLNLATTAYVSSGKSIGVGTATVVRNGQMLTAVRQSGFDSGVIGYLGFQFDPGDGLQRYGWAEVIITAQLNNSSFQVLEWAYEDTPDLAIQVGSTAVPEPEMAAVGLGVLAAGAAGLRRWRKRKAV